MANKSDWKKASRRLAAEQRQKLGDPPTAEELLAYSRGELSESEKERIRNLLVAYPELARMYSAPLPQDAEAAISEEEIAAGLRDVKRRLGIAAAPRRASRYIPTTIAAALALLFFGLYVRAETSTRDEPCVLGAPQELYPGGNRGASTPTVLRKDGEAYLLKPRLLNSVRYPHYSIELSDEHKVLWTTHAAEPDQFDTFQIVVPHSFFRSGGTYHLRIFGVDGETRRHAASYDVAVPAE